jgi:hypothetical protein
MNLILKTKYTLSTEFVLVQVRGNNHWRTSQVRLEILNDRTLKILWRIAILFCLEHAERDKDSEYCVVDVEWCIATIARKFRSSNDYRGIAASSVKYCHTNTSSCKHLYSTLSMGVLKQKSRRGGSYRHKQKFGGGTGGLGLAVFKA